MKVLHIVSSLAKISGVMSVIMNYYRHINRERIQFDFAYFFHYEDNYETEISSLGGSFHRISPPTAPFRFRNDLRRIQDLHAYDIIHVHEPYLVSFVKRSLKGVAYKSLVAHAHTTSFSDKRLSAIRNRLLCLNIQKSADYFFACSNAAGAAIFGKNILSRDNYFLLRNAVDLSNFVFEEDVRIRMRAALGVENNIVIGHVGRFNEQKNHKKLLHIFAAIRKIEPSALLIMAGFGPLEDDMKILAKSLSIEEYTHFLGMRNDVPELLQAMDLLLLPSLYEGLPVVGIEAQSTGLPILFADTITREAGILNYDYLPLEEDDEKWAEVVISLLKKGENSDRSRASKVLTESGYNIAVEAERLLNKYLSLAERR